MNVNGDDSLTLCLGSGAIAGSLYGLPSIRLHNLQLRMILLTSVLPFSSQYFCHTRERVWKTPKCNSLT